MPFEEIYAVHFGEGNLHPHINKHNWEDMQFKESMPTTPTTPDNHVEWMANEFGGTLRLLRPEDTAPGVDARGSVFVPTPGLTLANRIRLQLRFSSPQAEGFKNGVLLPITAPPALDVTPPESWALVLNVGRDAIMDPNNAANVTCQFTRLQGDGGFRLNTPGSIETNAGDNAAQLYRPLDYRLYRMGGEFTLEHSFCGLAASDTHPVIGSGYLRWDAAYQQSTRGPLEDQRLYSSDVFQIASNPAIGSVGATLVTRQGKGRISAHLISFRAWENKNI